MALCRKIVLRGPVVLISGIVIYTLVWANISHMSSTSRTYEIVALKNEATRSLKVANEKHGSGTVGKQYEQSGKLNLTKTEGHLSLPFEDSLFERSARQLDIMEPWRSRLRLLQHQCKNLQQLPYIVKDYRHLFSEQYNFSFCKAEKTGSTFMLNLFQVLEWNKSLSAVFKSFRDTPHGETRKYLSAMPSNNNRFKKILMTRDPYSRLFSVYIDKVFLIGLWDVHKEVGKQSGMLPYLVKGEQCGYTTSFQDFLKLYLIQDIENSDPHWRPVTNMCNACAVDFQLILKTETLSNDVKFFLDQIEVDEYKKSEILSVFGQTNNLHDVVRGLMTDYLYIISRHYVKETCSKVKTYMYRLWEGFKILGYIKKSVDFPESRFNALRVINVRSASEIIFDEMKKHPLSKFEKHLQKHDAMVAAYKTVSAETIELIKEYFKYDFLLFGYESEAPLH